ncbi:MAG: YraN family protein [Halioglobus sp.]
MRAIGDNYEDKAIALLTNEGVQILSRNFSRKTGEIDIIALDNQCLVFLEVRARKHRSFASAAASVDRRKQQRIVRTAQLYLRANPKWNNIRCRFDVIAFEPRKSDNTLAANWIRSAFTA